MLLSPVKEVERVAVVVLHHVAAVGFHRVRAGTLMKDHFGNGQLIAANAFDEVVLVEIVADRAFGQIQKLFALGEIVYGNDVLIAAAVEFEHVVAADEAGRAGNQNGH